MIAAIQSIIRWIYELTGNYGLAIILFTILVKILLYPLTLKQTKALEDQKKLTPEIRKIEEKYKNKPEEKQKKIMELYSKHNINPMSGCLPLLIQFPIIIILYQALLRYPDLSGGFLWIEDIASSPISVIKAHITVDGVSNFIRFFSPEPLLACVLPLLSAATTYLQNKALQAANPAPAPKDDSMPNPLTGMTTFMPMMILIFSFTLQKALVLYWVVNNIIALIQQQDINKRMKAARGEIG